MLGKVRILGTMKKFPAGVMVIPLLIGCIINTFFPDILTIGGFTTGLFKGRYPDADRSVPVLQRCYD